MIRRIVGPTFVFCSLAPVAAQEPAATQQATAPPPAESASSESLESAPVEYDVLQTERLTGDWWATRAALEERGFTIDLGMTTGYQHNARGGVQTKNAHRVSGSYDLELTLDVGALQLWEGGTVYALAGGSWDEGVSDRGYVGDYFGVNGDAGGDRAIDLSELWYEHVFFDERLRVRAGKIDLSVDFDTNAFANDETAQFLNNALIVSGNLPYPDPGHGVQFVATPCDWFYFGAGVADAEADVRETGFRTAYHGRSDFFSMYEFGLTPRFSTAWGELPGNYRFGL